MIKRRIPYYSAEHDCYCLPLTQGHTALIDECDVGSVSKCNWHILKSRSCMYGKARLYKDDWSKGFTPILLHRLIGDNAGLFTDPTMPNIDHINGNGLDNRRANLRACAQTNNNGNQKKTRGTSQYKGVSAFRNKWKAQIKDGKKNRYIGLFESEEMAAMAYNEAARKYFGEFALLNDLIFRAKM